MKNCLKVGYDTIEQAKQAIVDIRTEDKSPTTKPIRAYSCHKCSKFHITSMDKKKFNNVIVEVNKKHDRRRDEVSYWCDKLGVNNKGESFKTKRNVNKRNSDPRNIRTGFTEESD